MTAAGGRRVLLNPNKKARGKGGARQNGSTSLLIPKVEWRSDCWGQAQPLRAVIYFKVLNLSRLSELIVCVFSGSLNLARIIEGVIF